VAYSLADTVGGAAVISLHYEATPTVDMRMDYLAPVTDDLVAEAEVVRDGGSVSTADVTVRDVSGTRVAEARGVFKTGGNDGGSPWGGGPDEIDLGGVGRGGGDEGEDGNGNGNRDGDADADADGAGDR
jgi:hypothetical protein